MINKILTKNFDIPQNYEDFDIIQNLIHLDVLTKDSPGCLLFLEYKDVYTVGRFTKNKEYENIPFIRSSRGGDITFHGPGQQVFYPVINIKKLGVSLHDFVDLMHSFLIKFLQSKDISACRSKKGPGLWVDGNKISFFGVAVKKGVTLHGISLNIKCDLNKFELINPCGDASIKVGNLKILDKIERNRLTNELGSFFLDELKLFLS